MIALENIDHLYHHGARRQRPVELKYGKNKNTPLVAVAGGGSGEHIY